MNFIKIAAALLVMLLLASCDTGYTGETDPQNEVFNYKYPLKKGNEWEYLVKVQKTDFSNDSVATSIGADSVSYFRLKENCISDTDQTGNTGTYTIQRYTTSSTYTPQAIDTTSYTAVTTEQYVNTYDGLYEVQYHGAILSPRWIVLKYNIYPGTEWLMRDQTVLGNGVYAKIRIKFEKFTDLNTSIGTLRTAEMKADALSDDTLWFSQYLNYSLKGMAKLKYCKKYNKFDQSNTQLIGTYNEIVTQELIRTNVK